MVLRALNAVLARDVRHRVARHARRLGALSFVLGAPRLDAQQQRGAPPVVPYIERLSAAVAKQAADSATGLRVMVSVEQRRLWVVDASNDTLFTAAVAVGSGTTLRGGGKTWTFETPRGVARVIGKEENPMWIPPDWEYVEAARDAELALARLRDDDAVRLSDGRLLVVRHSMVGVIEADAIFSPLPLDEHIVFDGTLFIPPFGTKNRRVAGVLGPYRLLLGEGIALHGTPYRDTIGQAATHGCIRLFDEDVTWLYEHVPVGTRVVIY